MTDEEQIARFETMLAGWQTRTRAVLEVDMVAEKAVEHWQKDGLDLFLCNNPAFETFEKLRREIPDFHGIDCGPWNGYARFAKLPGCLPGYKGIYSYVPVHGGITYFQEWANGSVTYGFDTSHYNTDQFPVADQAWMKQQTEQMAHGICVAARFEPYYLRHDDEEKKRRVLLHMQRFLAVDLQDNFGALLRVIGGEL